MKRILKEEESIEISKNFLKNMEEKMQALTLHEIKSYFLEEIKQWIDKRKEKKDL